MKPAAAWLPPVGVTLFLSLAQGSLLGPWGRGLLALALALACLPLWWQDRGRRGLSPVDLVMMLFLALAALSALALAAWAPALVLGSWWVVGLYLLLLAMAVLPLLRGRAPFTTFFAQRQTPPALWQTEVFKTINRHLAWAWALLFLACGLLASLPALLPGLAGPHASLGLSILAPLALLAGLGRSLNRWYPPRYLRRLGLAVPTAATAQPPSGAAAAPSSVPTASSKEQVMSAKPTVVALNGSPHAGMGNSAQLIEMLRPSLEDQGLELEVINLAGKNILYCQGCAFCLAKGRCWIDDDHRGILDRLLAADAVVLASPVYFYHVTAQMKTFLDRCLGFGHKPRGTWKPGLAISVAAAVGETEVASYLSNVLKTFGAYSVGDFTALATGPGGFLGLEAVRQRAEMLARDLALAIKEQRRYPATGRELVFYLFMKDLVTQHKGDAMAHDYKHWEEHGLLEGFEAYVGQKYTEVPYNEEARVHWVRQMIAAYKDGRDPASLMNAAPPSPDSPAPALGPQAATSCLELLRMMPQGFNAAASQGLKAVVQFEVRGDEHFSAHLVIADGTCRFVEGPAPSPDVTIKTPAQVWLDISAGRLDGQSAFMAGQYQVEGNLMLLLRFKDLFQAG